MSSLLGNIVRKFAYSAENVASESLLQILNNSESANNFFCEYFRDQYKNLPLHLHYKSQVFFEDKGIPDIIGIAPGNEIKLIVEAKFWAGLTENQPNQYLKILEEQYGGILCFVVPELRLSIIWKEILHRASSVYPIDIEGIIKSDSYSVQLSNTLVLSIVSWQSILGKLKVLTSDIKSVNDIDQLIGLCDELNTEEFLPISSEELSSKNALRYIQYSNIIDLLTETFA